MFKMAYVAQYGEYDNQTPIGVFDNLVSAQMAVIASKPTYDTEVEVFNLETGKLEIVHIYDVLNKSWTEDRNV